MNSENDRKKMKNLKRLVLSVNLSWCLLTCADSGQQHKQNWCKFRCNSSTYCQSESAVWLTHG